MKSTIAGLLFSAGVLCAALFSLSLGPLPVCGATAIRADLVQVNGIAVGHDGDIARSDDVGAHWEVRIGGQRPDPLLSIRGNGALVFAAGSFGRLLASHDAGDHARDRGGVRLRHLPV